MEFKDIKSIVDLMKKNALSEFEMEKEGFRIKLRRASREGKSDEVQVQHYLPPVAPAPAEVPATVSAPEPIMDTEPTVCLKGLPCKKPTETVSFLFVERFFHVPVAAVGVAFASKNSRRASSAWYF